MNPVEYEKLKTQIMRHEDIVLQHGRAVPYVDTVGKSTIGFGRNLSDRGLSLDECHVLLNNDLDECIWDCQSFPWFDGLNDVRKRVLINMRFNLGSKGLRTFRNTLASMGRGDYEAAAKGMLASKWRRQTKGRAVELAEMMRTGHD